MSMLGALAMGVAGGASAFAGQAQGDIEKNQKLDLAKQAAEIESQMRMRMADYTEKIRQSGRASDFTADNDQGNVAMRAATQDTMLRSAGKTAQAVDLERLANTELTAAGQAKTASDAKASNKSMVDLTTENAGNKAFQQAKWTDLMSDPRIKGAYISHIASAGASGEQAKLAGEHLKQLKAVGDRAIEIRGLQEQIKNAPDESTKEVARQKITDVGFVGKDPTRFLSLAEKAQDNARDAVKMLLDPMIANNPDSKANRLRCFAGRPQHRVLRCGTLRHIALIVVGSKI